MYGNVFQGGNRWNTRNILIIFCSSRSLCFDPSFHENRRWINAKFDPYPTCCFFIKSKKKKKKRTVQFEVQKRGINTRFNLHDVRFGESFGYQISCDETFETLGNRSAGFWWNHDRCIVRVTNVRRRSHRWNSMGCLLRTRDRWFIALAFKQIRMQRFIHRSILLEKRIKNFWMYFHFTVFQTNNSLSMKIWIIVYEFENKLNRK